MERSTAAVRILAWNVQGGLGQTGGLEGRLHRIRSLALLMAERGAVLGVLAEPRLPPGVEWPEWTQYRFYGERSTAADTVAVDLGASEGGDRSH